MGRSRRHRRARAGRPAGAPPLRRPPHHARPRPADHRPPRGVAAPVLRLAAAPRAGSRSTRRPACRRPGRAAACPVCCASDEIEVLLDDGPPPTDDPIEAAVALRDTAVLEVLYGSGLRVSELCGLRPDDIDLVRARLTVMGKGRRSARSRCSTPAVDALRAWLDAGRRHPRLHRDARRRRVRQPPCAATLTTGREANSRPAGRRTHQSARPPAHVRHSSSGRRCRPSCCTGTSRPRRPRHDPALHPREPGAPARRARDDASSSVGRAVERQAIGGIEDLWARYRADAVAGRPRPADRPLLAAGEVRRRPGRRRAPPERRARRPRQLRDVRADRRHRQVRPRPGLQVRDLRHQPDQGRHPRRAPLDRLGAALGAGQGPGPRDGPTPSSRPRTPARRPTPSWPRRWR